MADILPLMRQRHVTPRQLEKYAVDLLLAQDDLTARELVDEVEKYVPSTVIKQEPPRSSLNDYIDKAVECLHATGVRIVQGQDVGNCATIMLRSSPYHVVITGQTAARRMAEVNIPRINGGKQIRILGKLRRLWWLGEGKPPDFPELERRWHQDSLALAEYFAQSTLSIPNGSASKAPSTP